MKVLSIFGYGSLMTYSSVLRTMPNAVHHRGGTLQGYSRTFSLVSISGVRSGTADFDTLEVAALGVRPCSSPDAVVRGVLFDIPEDEFAAFVEREHRYRVLKLPVIDADAYAKDSDGIVEAWVVVEQTDEQYRGTMSSDEYESRVGRYYSGQLWGRPDIKPMREYLSNCIIAADAVDTELGQHDNAHLTNFLDECLLANGATSIREYVFAHQERFGEDVMALVMKTAKSNL